MSNIPISSLPIVISLDGSEAVPLVQGGTTKRATINQIASSLPNLAGYAKLSANNTFTGLNTFNNTLTINPPPGSVAQGVTISQTSPVGGSFTGPLSFNTVNVADQGVTITSPGTDTDSFGLSTGNMVGFRVNYSSVGGPIRGAMIAAYRATASTAGSYYGFAGSIYTNVTSGGLLWGNIGVAQVGPAGSASLIVGLEGEVAVYGSGTVQQRVGVSSNTQGPNAAVTDLDAAYAVTAGGGTAGFAPFKKMFAISSVLYGGAPLAATGDIFWADTPFTIANVFNSSNWTVTGNFADFPHFGINGPTGQAAFGAPIAGIPANYGLWVTGASKGNIGLGVSTNTTTGSSFIDVGNSQNTAEVVLLANEAARTTVRYGLTLGNYTEMSSFSGNGQIIATNNSAPLIFATNNVIRAQITSGGLVNIGPNVASSALLTVNANTAAPSSGGSNVVLQMSGADGAGSQALMDNYGGTKGAFAFRSARGPCSAFTASQSGDDFGIISFVGAAANNTFVNTTGGAGGAIIAGTATENWSAIAQGSKLKFFTTPNGTAAVALGMTLQNSGCLSIGTTVDAGAPGIINLLTGLRIGNAAANGNVLRGNGSNFVSAQLGITDLSGLGANVATWLAAPSSANLAAAVTDETGSGALVFGTSPTLSTPVINGLPTGTGVATANTVSTLVARDGSGNFSAGTITATLSGNATTATTSTTATNATNSTITNDTTTNASMNLTWVTSNTGNLPLKTTSTKLTFNPSTGALSATSFSGALTGATGLPLTTGVTGTLPIANGGTGIATGPGTPNFRAYLTSSQSVTTGVTTKVLFDTVDWDTGSYWSAANHNYKPLVSGTYLVTFAVVPSLTSGIVQPDGILGVISKNGLFGSGGVSQLLSVSPTTVTVGSADIAGVSGSTLVQMNGSTDTIEIDISFAGTSPVINGSANRVTQVSISRIGP